VDDILDVEGTADDLGKTARYRSEKLVAFANDLPGRERAALPLSRWRLVLRSGVCGSKGDKAKRQAGKAQSRAHQMLLGCWSPKALFNRMLILTAVTMWPRRLILITTITENMTAARQQRKRPF
jgi:hypothetical protein